MDEVCMPCGQAPGAATASQRAPTRRAFRDSLSARFLGCRAGFLLGFQGLRTNFALELVGVGR